MLRVLAILVLLFAPSATYSQEPIKDEAVSIKRSTFAMLVASVHVRAYDDPIVETTVMGYPDRVHVILYTERTRIDDLKAKAIEERVRCGLRAAFMYPAWLQDFDIEIEIKEKEQTQ